MHNAEELKNKIVDMFKFIKAFEISRRPIRRELKDQPFHELQIALDKLPVGSEHVKQWNGLEGEREWLLQVKLPPVFPCPTPPVAIEDWLVRDWIDPGKHEPSYVQTKSKSDGRGFTVIEAFEDNDARLRDWHGWCAKRTHWHLEYLRNQPVRELFAKLQTLRSTLQKDSEKLELVLGCCNFKGIAKNTYHHPLIYKPVSIVFDANTNVFSILETEQTSELYVELLADLAISNLTPSDEWRKKLQNLHPLDEQTKILTKAIDDYFGNQSSLQQVSVSHSPIIFVRDKGDWVARAAQAVLDDISKKDITEIPVYLQKLAGANIGDNIEDDAIEDWGTANETQDVLLALPANPEQLQLARQITKKDVILVQGPPGTGKTHTIANLIGHLLAQGQRILVTSHTSKALRVLRDKVPENIRNLCVSVLGDDPKRSRKELEQSAQAIAEKMQAGQLFIQANMVKKAADRNKLLEEIRETREKLKQCIQREYAPIIFSGESIKPLEAAKWVSENQALHGWIPTSLMSDERGKLCPLSVEELHWLYRNQVSLSAVDEEALAMGLPDLQALPKPEELQQWMAECDAAKEKIARLESPIWPKCTANAQKLEDIIQQGSDVFSVLDDFKNQGEWLISIAESGWVDGAKAQEWQRLFELIADIKNLYKNNKSNLLEYDPKLPDELLRNEKTASILFKIIQYLEKNGNIGLWQKMTMGWGDILKKSECNNKKPTQKIEFEALLHHHRLFHARQRLLRLWERQVLSVADASKYAVLHETMPEETASDWIVWLTKALDWNRIHWQALVKETVSLGKNWAFIDALTPPFTGIHPRIVRAQNQLKVFINEWQTHLSQRRLEALQKQMSQWQEPCRAWSIAHKGAVTPLETSLNLVDIESYRQSYQALVRVLDLQHNYEKRNALLIRLKKGARGWHQILRNRDALHTASYLDGKDIVTAWRWRQLNDELVYRAQLDQTIISARLNKLSISLEGITSELIEYSTWEKQLHAAQKYRQHLMGWLQTQARIGKGTGQGAEQHRINAREQLKQGQNAIPVWIMPLAQVFQSLTIEDSRFDVVIIDEASQAGISGLLAAYLGKKVIVVGDHEQVSPDGVGTDNATASTLQHQYLQNIPNSHLYDSKLSLYDLSRGVACGMLSLTEHFRCVPAIIGFSNQLSYDGKIKPLRPPTASQLLPHVVPHRVQGKREGRSKINQVEATEIVSLIAAMCEHPQYVDKTIGVISLLGDEQVQLIERKLQARIKPVDYENRRILCGNAAQFQGDERHVMLLSMVDSNEGDGPMRKTGEGANEMTKKRYNVAASRAQDQMWVVHSIDFETDLKPDDLRRDLLQHTHIEVNKFNAFNQPIQRTDSEFERLVLDELLVRGYQVKTQVSVGFYRLDMVVESVDGKRLAIECDGDKWHSGVEKISEDLARQAQLERLGWKFYRIGGSQFFRERHNTLNTLWQKLNAMNILPVIDKVPSIELVNNLREDIIRRAQALQEQWG